MARDLDFKAFEAQAKKLNFKRSAPKLTREALLNNPADWLKEACPWLKLACTIICAVVKLPFIPDTAKAVMKAFCEIVNGLCGSGSCG